MPVRAYTRQWAYYDPGLHNGQVALGDDGYIVTRDAATFLWFADRATNRDYLKPAYYLCFSGQNLTTIRARISGNWRIAGPDVDLRCSDNELVRRAAAHEQDFLQHKLVAKDSSPRDRWAIVQLDWDYPPFLRRLHNGGFIEIAKNRGTLEVNYEFAHQEGKPERAPLLRVYTLGRSSGMCEGVQLEDNRRPAHEIEGKAIQVPHDKDHWLQLALVPRTQTKRGPEYLSRPFRNTRQGIEFCHDAFGPLCRPTSCSSENLEVKDVVSRRLPPASWIVTWTRDVNATRYEVFAGSPASGGEILKVTSGNETALIIEPHAERDLYIRACNAAGCAKVRRVPLP
jgi:hypothetical protein